MSSVALGEPALQCEGREFDRKMLWSGIMGNVVPRGVGALISGPKVL